mgnify:CR=1 FL=1
MQHKGQRFKTFSSFVMALEFPVIFDTQKSKWKCKVALLLWNGSLEFQEQDKPSDIDMDLMSDNVCKKPSILVYG